MASGESGRSRNTISPAEAQAALRVAVSIVLTLVLAGPGLVSAAQGQRDFQTAAIWFLLTFLATRLGLAIVYGVWLGYRRQIDTDRAQAEQRSLVLEVDRRRAENRGDNNSTGRRDNDGDSAIAG